jgi:hypothetical protein
MVRIPTVSNRVPKQFHSHNYDRLLRAAKLTHRSECLRRAGSNDRHLNNHSKDYRICSHHPTETVDKVVDFIDLKDNLQSITVSMIVPIEYDNFNNNNSYVTPFGKSNRCIIDNNNNTLNRDGQGSLRSKIERAKQISAELSEQLGINKEQFETIILQTLKKGNNDPTPSTTLENDDTAYNKPNKRLKVLMDNHNNNYVNRSPKIILDEMDDCIIKTTTGFPSLSALTCYVIVLHRGNIKDIINTKSTLSLTWFEEWVVVFERLWGRSISRWGDAT